MRGRAAAPGAAALFGFIGVLQTTVPGVGICEGTFDVYRKN